MNQEEIWDKIASPWENFRNESVLNVEEFLKDKKGHILDLGCGSGRNFFKLNDVVLYGVDFSSEMLKLAKKSARKRGIKIKLRKAEVFNTKYKNNFFDAVVFNAVLHCVDSKDNREKSVKELFRIMKPGSKAFVSVWSKNHKRVKNKPKECNIPWSVGTNKYLRYYYLYTLKEFKKLFLDVGFLIVKFGEGENIYLVVEKP